MTKQIPPGYKQTKVGVIPDDWGRFELNEILSISSEKFNPITNIENRRCIELEHLSQETGKNLGFVNSNEQQSVKNVFVEGQVLFGKLRPYLKKFWKATFDGVCSSEIWVINGKKVSNNYLFFLVQTNKFIQVANVSSGSKMPRADWSYMSEVPFIVPLFQKEQEKIAEILSTWDDAITKQEQLIEQKQAFKKGIIQQIFSQKIRFKDDNGNDYQKWQESIIGDILEESTERSTTNDQHMTLSSTTNGVISQAEYFNKKIASENNCGYKILRLGQIVLSPQNAWLGNINFNDKYEIGIVSPSYKIFSVRNQNVKKYIKYLIKYKSFQNIIELFSITGASIVRKSLDLNSIMNYELLLPTISEQAKIADFLTSIDHEITKQTEILDQLILQKNSLMQKLLTGQIRTNHE